MNNVPVVAASISLAAAVVTVVLGAIFESGRRRARRRDARRDLSSSYRDPLLQAASSLASRLGNVDPGQIDEFGFKLPARFRDYAVYESMYRFGRYLCWVHILASEVHFLDLGTRRRNRRLVERLAAVQVAISDRAGDPAFLLLGGEQWALGSLLIEPGADGRARCMSYVDFRHRIDTDPQFQRWFRPLENDLNKLLGGAKDGLPRLARTHAELLRLIRLLDPAKVWASFEEPPAELTARTGATSNHE